MQHVWPRRPHHKQNLNRKEIVQLLPPFWGLRRREVADNVEPPCRQRRIPAACEKFIHGMDSKYCIYGCLTSRIFKKWDRNGVFPVKRNLLLELCSYGIQMFRDLYVSPLDVSPVSFRETSDPIWCNKIYIYIYMYVRNLW